MLVAVLVWKRRRGRNPKGGQFASGPFSGSVDFEFLIDGSSELSFGGFESAEELERNTARVDGLTARIFGFVGREQPALVFLE